MAITHVLNVQIGFDLTDILSPENIPGVKAYLGVKSDNDLVSAIFQDKLNQVNKVLSQNGFNVINAGAQEVQTSNVEQQQAPTVIETPEKETITEKEPIQETTVKDASNDDELYQKKQELLARLKKEIGKVKRARGNIEVIKYNANIIPYAPSPAELQHEAKIKDDVAVDVEETDDDVLVVISYIDKENKMQTKIIKEEK